MWANEIFSFIRQHGIVSVVLGGLIEQIIVPIPSPIIPMAAGFLLISPQTSFWLTFKQILFKAAIPFAIGSTLGSTIVYLIAWFGGKWLIDRYSKWFSFTWKDIEKFQTKFFHGKSTDELLIFVFRAIPMIPSVLVSAVAGTIRTKPRSFYFYTFIGLFIRGVILGFVGYESGEALFKISGGLDKIETIFSVIILSVIVIGLFLAFKGREKWLKKLGIGD